MAEHREVDHGTRAEAIRPEGSFIVQAPAGSGKTSLLTQRFLRLLAEVARPEEIVAITFTRKAAAEMRHRIVEALGAADRPPPAGAAAHDRTTRDLARAALDNGRRRGWDLVEQPSRLHIQTIDGLSHWLAARLPLSARIGLSPTLLDDARPLFAAAARRFASRLEEDAPLSAHIVRLSRLLDHEPARLETLLADMLARREIWLPKLYGVRRAGDVRSAMERLLEEAAEAALAGIRADLGASAFLDIVQTLRAAARRDPQGPLAVLARGTGLPGSAAADREAWECIAQALLRKDGKARKQVDKNTGFPPDMKAEKAAITSGLALLADREDWLDALGRVAGLPPPGFTDAQWDLVEALVEVLVPAAAELQALFGERSVADHAAVAAAARFALGDDEAPSELALALDYRIRHLLVDEYQDTSPVQQQLLQRLVAGWQPGDGHSLFCVGDPMQSIYGFREADVTLFLEARDRGIGGVPLETRSLSSNFRSCAAIVDWVNATFAQVMPTRADYQQGAVPYTRSVSTRPDEQGAGVQVHPMLDVDDEEAARALAGIIEQSLAEISALEQAEGEAAGADPREVAVLVRARTSLPPLLAELRRRGIAYRGVELESLADRAAVRDVLALARALLHPGDRTAWLSVLRAPWCGLTLEDLHALASDDGRTPILSRMLDAECLGRLSADGRQRLDRVRAVLLASRDDHGRQSLGSWVRACWLALQAPATLEDPVDLDNVESCFVALDRLAAEVGPMPSGSEVEAAVDGLMASPTGSADARVQLMTIHKAKGLEFDTVILPGLEKTVASHSRQLLYWATVAVEGAPRGIVLASRGEPGDERQPDRLEAWMRGLEVKRAELELGRLAYVAATRARRRLHLAGAVRTDLHKEGHTVLKPPRKGSMLRLLWKVLEGDFEDALGSRGEAEGPDTSSGRPRRSAPPLTRLPLEFEAPSRPASVAVTGPQRRRAADGPIRPQFEWAGAEAIAVGTVLHAELERLGRERRPVRSLVARPDDWANGLQRLGLPQDRLPGAVARIGAAVTRLVRSETAARLLDPDADQAASELGLTAWLDGEFATVKIDRTFVDAEGVRWIVDWKTGSHEGADVEQFLAQEVGRYGAQLERYARVMALHDPRPQCVGLYFPLLDRWKAWSP